MATPDATSTLPPLPREVDDIIVIREAVIETRNAALRANDFKTAVFLTHVTAWLSWAAEVLGRQAELRP